MKLDSFKSKLIESFFGNITTYLLNMLFPFVVTKLYGSAILGSYTYGVSIIMMTIFFATLGLDIGMLYFIPRKGNKYVTASFVVNIVSSAVIIAILYTFIDDTIVRSMLPLVWLLSAKNIFFSIYRAQGNIKEFFWIDIAFGLVGKIALSAIFFKFFGASAYSVIAATYIATVLSCIYFLFEQRKLFGAFHLDSEVIKYSLPLIVGSMMTLIINNIDMIMIGNMLDKEAVAVYSVAAKIATLPSILLLVLNTVFPPMVAKLYHDGKLEELRNIYKKSARTLAVLASIIIFFLIVFRTHILGYFGDIYLSGEYVIVYRGIGQLFNAAVGSVWYIVIMTGHPKIDMIGKLSAAAINVFFNILFIPIYGITGAALASMIAVCFGNILGYLVVKRILKVKVYGII